MPGSQLINEEIIAYVKGGVVLLWIIFFFVLLWLAIIHLRNYKKFSTYLKESDPLVWRTLGEPSLSNTTPRNVMRLLNFLNTFESDDMQLKLLGLKTKRVLRIFLFVLSIEIVLFILILVVNKK